MATKALLKKEVLEQEQEVVVLPKDGPSKKNSPIAQELKKLFNRSGPDLEVVVVRCDRERKVWVVHHQDGRTETMKEGVMIEVELSSSKDKSVIEYCNSDGMGFSGVAKGKLLQTRPTSLPGHTGTLKFWVAMGSFYDALNPGEIAYKGGIKKVDYLLLDKDCSNRYISNPKK